MKIAIVDRYAWYSWNLSKVLSESLGRNGSVFFYGNKRRNWAMSPGKTILKPTWSPYLYPFEIFREALRDKPNITHIQFEAITFGSPYTCVLLPLLLFLLRAVDTKIVVTIHGVVPRNIGKDVVGYLMPALVPPLIAPLKLFFISRCES